MNTAILVRHRSKPGMRERVRSVWEKHVRPRVADNPEHLSYFYCFDHNDADVICAFQVYSDATAPERFMAGPWYDAYLAEIAPLVAESPQISACKVEWAKPPDPRGGTVSVTS